MYGMRQAPEGAMNARTVQPRGQRHDERANRALAIETELARHLVNQAPTGFAIGVVAVLVIVLVMWRAAPLSALVTWLASMVVLTLPTPIVVWRFRRSPDPSAAIASWRRALTVAYGIAGIGWGLVAVVLYPRVDMPHQLFLIFVTGGAGVSGMAALAAIRGGPRHLPDRDVRADDRDAARRGLAAERRVGSPAPRLRNVDDGARCAHS